MGNPMTDETARTMRRLWFDYLDAFEPVRPTLQRYCLKLTGSIFDAEDLVQNTLLFGFGSLGRADRAPHDPDGLSRRWFDKPDAYLAQIATDLWTDRGRRAISETLRSDIEAVSEKTIDAFIAAWNAKDRVRTISLLLDKSVIYEVLGNGREKGTQNAIWIDTPRRKGVVAERFTIDGELVVAFTFTLEDHKYLAGVERLEEVDGRISRVISYHFCPDTIAAVAREIGIKPWSNGYRPDEETLKRIVAEAELPWGGPSK